MNSKAALFNIGMCYRSRGGSKVVFKGEAGAGTNPYNQLIWQDCYGSFSTDVTGKHLPWGDSEYDILTP